MSKTPPIALTIRRARERRQYRCRGRRGWHTFDVRHRPNTPDRFGELVLLNEYRLEPGARLPHCARSDAILLIYLRNGTLFSLDADEARARNNAGEFFLSRASRSHERHNPSATRWAHVFVVGLYAEGSEEIPTTPDRFYANDRRDKLSFVATPDGRHGSLRTHQNTVVYSSILAAGRHLIHELAPGERVWMHVVHGEVTLGELILAAGDGVGIQNARVVSFTARSNSEILLTVLEGCDSYHHSEGVLALL